MVDILEALGNSVRDNFCSATSNLSTAVSIGADLYDRLGQTTASDLISRQAQFVGGAADLVCNRTPRNTAALTPVPFSGGQCVGDIYTIFVSRNGGPESDRTTTTDNNPIEGPIQNIRQVTNEFGLFDYVITVGNGTVNAGTNFTTPQNWVITRVENLTVPADPCGNPPPSTPPFDQNDFTFTDNITYDDDGGNPVNISPDLNFRPIILGPGAKLEVPINITFEDGASLVGNLDLSTGDIEFNNTNTGGDGVPSGGEELTTNPDQLPPRTVIIGVRVIALVDPDVSKATRIFQTGDNPDIYAPRLGNLQFLYRTPSGAAGWSADIPIKNVNQVIWAESDAVSVAASPEIGTTLQLFPIIKLLDCEDECC